MGRVRIGIVGIGIMGTRHSRYLAAGKVPGAELVAVADTDRSRLKWAQENLSGVRTFSTAEELFASGTVDGVLIATPHYDHPPQAIRAMQSGLHVLIEKPAGAYTKQVREMNAVAMQSDTVFGVMYNQRTNPVYQKLRQLIQNCELGDLKRTNWIITSWYRPQSYYDSGGWRATWAGEGGGVLLNQDPHQLDLWQWMCGMPTRVRAFCSFGKYHDIEVEDDVTAYVEYENGATGVFVTSTGDAPGTNRLEITGDRGKIVVEHGELTFWRLEIPERQFNREWTGGFGAPLVWKCEIPVSGEETSHAGITADWVNSIQHGSKLLAPGVEGINGLEISNAMHLSAWTDDWVDIPVDADKFYALLQKRIQSSTIKRNS